MSIVKELLVSAQQNQDGARILSITLVSLVLVIVMGIVYAIQIRERK